MFDNEQDESPRKTRKSWPILTAVAAVLLILAAFLFWQFLPSQGASGSSHTAAAAAATARAIGTSSADTKTGEGDPPIYWQTIEQQIAEGLHLTVEQVKARLQPPPGQRDGPSIAVIAAQQGIPEARWRTIEINAIQKGHDLLVSRGYLSQQGSDQGMQTIRNWDQATLDDHVTRWFLNN